MIRRFMIVVALVMATGCTTSTVVGEGEFRPAVIDETVVGPPAAAEEQSAADPQAVEGAEGTEVPPGASVPDDGSGAVPADAGAGSPGCTAEGVLGRVNGSLSVQRQRTFEAFHSPVNQGQPRPVLIVWHRAQASASEMFNWAQLERLSTERDWIVVAPDAVRVDDDDETVVPSSVDGTWELNDDDDPTSSDRDFADQLVRSVKQNFCVDSSRVYAAGIDDGGRFAQRIVCELPDVFAAVVTVSSAIEEPCSSGTTVSHLAIQGSDDQLVGDVSSTFTSRNGLEGCESLPVDEPDAAYRRARWQCAQTTHELVEVEAHGHGWPGSSDSAAVSEQLGFGPTSLAFDATAAIADFLDAEAAGGG